MIHELDHNSFRPTMSLPLTGSYNLNERNMKLQIFLSNPMKTTVRWSVFRQCPWNGNEGPLTLYNKSKFESFFFKTTCVLLNSVVESNLRRLTTRVLFLVSRPSNRPSVVLVLIPSSLSFYPSTFLFIRLDSIYWLWKWHPLSPS